MFLFVLGCGTSGNDPDDISFLTMAVTDHQQAESGAHAKDKETILPVGVFIIIEFNTAIIKEHRASFFKRDTMFALVLAVFALIPLKRDLIHNDNVITTWACVKRRQISILSVPNDTNQARCKASRELVVGVLIS